MTATATQWAIASNLAVPTLDCIAVCEVWTYDVVGNAKDGWEVNDRACEDRAAQIRARAFLHNAQRRPGASDDVRSFDGESASAHNGDMFLSWTLTLRAIRAAVGGRGYRVSADGDDMTYYLETPSGKPVGEIIITGWEDLDA